MTRRNKSGLLASSSLCALLLGGVPAYAACPVVITGNVGGCNNAVTITGIKLHNATVSGSIVSTGNITPNGISIDSASKIAASATFAIAIGAATFAGGITNAGTISQNFFGGIAIGVTGTNGFLHPHAVTTFSGGITNAGTIAVTRTGILVQNVSTFTGGISNKGTIAANGLTGPGNGIFVSNVAQFGNSLGGGISNGGTISAVGAGISVVSVGTFFGGISNSGTISATGAAIAVSAAGTFSGGISNSGMISANNAGIVVQNVTIFSGGISNGNTGTISVTFGDGIQVNSVTAFSGGISNFGTISAGSRGIAVLNTSTFSGGISNAGTITAGNRGIVVSSALQFGTNSLGGGISNSGTISAGHTGIFVNNTTNFSGGISNTGRISASDFGISVANVTIFSGGISNSNTGTISVAFGDGILVQSVTFFSGGISNGGTISAGSRGIAVLSPTIFSGGISNAGRITAGNRGIVVTSAAQFGTNSPGGGISNAGTISAGHTGIFVNLVNNFSGGIGNAGTITAGTAGIRVTNVTTFAGGISNGGTILATQLGIVIGETQFGTQASLSAFSGGISNSGTISAGSVGVGIDVLNVTTFTGGITNSGTITVANGAGIVVGATLFFGNVSNSGTISGARTGIFICNCATLAGGAIINTGNISASVAAIDASQAPSAITIDQMAGTLTGAIKLSANADVLNISGGTIAGNIIGQGSSNTINFALGSGTFTYGNAYGFSGINQVNVNSGTVVLDGTNRATDVAVNGGLLQIGDAANPSATLTSTTPVDVAGGTLAGHGTINGGVIVQNGATLMPGGSIGTLTINGNLVMSPGSFYDVELSATQASKTQVNGAATLGGANVDAVVSVVSQFGRHAGNTYTILTATTPFGAGNIFNPAVSFNGVTSAEKLVLFGTASLSYDANDAFLNVPNYAILLAAPANASLNAQNVANGFNTALLAGVVAPPGFQNLANISGNALGNALNQLAGQSQGSFGPVGFETGNQFLNLMLNPYIDGRPGFSTSPPPLAYAPQQSSAPAANAFSAVALGPRPFFEPRLNFWASAYGGDGRISGNAFTGAANTNSQIYGVATGVDYLALPNTIFGLALGGGGTAWQLGQGMGTGHSDMFQAGLYARSQLGPAYVAGAFAYSLHDVTTNRNVTLAGFDSLQGNFSADVLSMRLEGGYRLPYGVVAVTPYGAVQSQDMFLPAYSEFATSGSSQFALNYTNRTFTATRTEIGAWFDSDALMANGIKVYSRLAWAHDFDNEGASIAFFQSLPGSNFLINSSKPARDGALTTVGFEYKLADGWSVLGKFDGEFSSTTAIFAGTGTIRKVW